MPDCLCGFVKLIGFADRLSFALADAAMQFLLVSFKPCDASSACFGSFFVVLLPALLISRFEIGLVFLLVSTGLLPRWRRFAVDVLSTIYHDGEICVVVSFLVFNLVGYGYVLKESSFSFSFKTIATVDKT